VSVFIGENTDLGSVDQAVAFNPFSLNSAWPAAARQVKCAIWQTVVKANGASAGNPRMSGGGEAHPAPL
jgi:hypothetical protein